MRYLKRNRHGWEYQRRVPVDLKNYLADQYPNGWVRNKLSPLRADAVREVAQITAHLETEWSEHRGFLSKEQNDLSAVKKNLPAIKSALLELVDTEGPVFEAFSDDAQNEMREEIRFIEDAGPEDIHEFLKKEQPKAEIADKAIYGALNKLELELLDRGIDPTDHDVARTLRNLLLQNPAQKKAQKILSAAGLKSAKAIKVNPQGLMSLCRQWQTEVQPSQKVSSDSERLVERWIELHGDLHLEEITREHGRNFREALQNIPARLPRTLQKMTYPELLSRELPGKSRANSTLCRQMGIIKTLLSHAVDAGHIDHNPIDRIRVPKAALAKTKPRREFKENEIQIILDAVRGQSPAFKYWVHLGVFTGARSAEIIGLRPEDLTEIEGVICIRIVDHVLRSVKTTTSNRIVPLHMGLGKTIEWMDSRAGEELIIPNVSVVQKAVENYSHKFRRLIENSGIRIRGQETFQSLRHSFRAALRDADVKDEFARRLLGHVPLDIHEKYGNEVPVKSLADAVNRVYREIRV